MNYILDNLTAKQRRKNMQHIKNKDTLIELKLRKKLWNKGYRYRKNVNKLPGKPDIVLSKYKIAIFCDSEFFHGKDWDALKSRLEKSNNSEYWIKKISRNRQRDDEINKRLSFMGWTVVRFWGKEILTNSDECVSVIGGRVIPGASTIHFDEISRKRIFQAIDNANFSDIKLIRENYTNLKNKLGHIPALADFDKYGEMDVLRIFDNNSLGSYYKFLVKYEKEYTIRLSEDEEKAIEFISKKLACGKRIHELELLKRTL